MSLPLPTNSGQQTAAEEQQGRAHHKKVEDWKANSDDLFCLICDVQLNGRKSELLFWCADARKGERHGEMREKEGGKIQREEVKARVSALHLRWWLAGLFALGVEVSLQRSDGGDFDPIGEACVPCDTLRAQRRSSTRP